MPGPEAGALERAVRESSGRAVATLVRLFGDIDLAEEAVQEAFTVAAERWAEGAGRAAADPGGAQAGAAGDGNGRGGASA